MNLRVKALHVVIFFFTLGNIFAQEAENDVGVEEHLGEYMPMDVQLTDVNDSLVTFKDLIHKPTVLNFVYYRCPGICTPLMNGLKDVVNRSDLKLGIDYNIVTISFDPTENAELAKRKKSNYSKLLNNKDENNGWQFFTADSGAISQLTKAAGFKYKETGNEYLHTATLIMLAPDGKISRYLNGVTFLPIEFKLGLTEAAQGKIGPTINRILLYCFSYDPEGHKYVLNITRVTGVILTILAIILILFLSLKPILKKRKQNK